MEQVCDDRACEIIKVVFDVGIYVKTTQKLHFRRKKKRDQTLFL